MINRLPFAYLAPEVDKLYAKEFADDDIKGIEAQCEFIAEYLRANGWDEESYCHAIMGVQTDAEIEQANKKAN
jgi:hypothetical protein